MDGYLDDPVATAAAFDGDWLRTGDVAEMVDDEVVIVGRLKEMINRNGLRHRRVGLRARGAGDRGCAPGPGRGVRRRRRRRRARRAARRVALTAARAGEVVLALRARLADAGLPADVVELVPAGLHPPHDERQAAARGARRARRWRSAAAVSGGEALLPREVASLRVLDER